MTLPNNFDQRIQWILDYFKFPYMAYDTFSKSLLVSNEYLDITCKPNDFEVLMVKIENIEIVNSLIAEFPMPDTEENFKTLMRIFKFNQA